MRHTLVFDENKTKNIFYIRNLFLAFFSTLNELTLKNAFRNMCHTLRFV